MFGLEVDATPPHFTANMQRIVSFALVMASASAFIAPSQSAWTARQSVAPRTELQSAVVDDIMDKLKGLTLLEASELVKEIEDTFGVDASAGGGGMMMAMPGMMGGGGEAAAEEKEEQTEFDVVLSDVPADKKIAILKIVRTITGLGLKEAKDMVEKAPVTIKEAAAKDEVDSIKAQIEEAGGKIEAK